MKDLIKLQPDLYSRNFFVSKILQKIAGENKDIKIIDVGGRGGKLYEFLPKNYNIQIFDTLPNDYNEPNYIQGDALNIGFNDKAFDFVTSLETLEHIPKKSKYKFIQELLRVSKYGVILTAPFYSPHVKQAEGYLNDLYYENLGRMHPWLKEHLESTLPKETELEKFCKENGVYFKKIGQNNLNNWILFMGINFLEEVYETTDKDTLAYYENYNKNFMKLGDSFDPSYRKIYFLTKDKNLVDRLNIDDLKSKKDENLYEKFVYDSLSLLSERIHQKEFDFTQLQKQNERLNSEVKEIQILIDSYKKTRIYKLGQGFTLFKKIVKVVLNQDKIKKGFKILFKYGPRAIYNKFRYSQVMDVQYNDWLMKNALTTQKIEEMKDQEEKFTSKPKISILLPVYNTPEKFLRRAIDSVINQIYKNWELCIADDASNDENIKLILEEYKKKDKRIKVIYREKNGGISVASNTALKMVTGEFIGVLDHDDIYWPNALFETVKVLNEHPKADLIYSDEDKIDENENHSGPFFKPDYSPDLLLSMMYMTHFLALRKSLADKIGLFNEKYPGTQDWDYILRTVEQTKEVYHIPNILYSFRMWSGSTAGNPRSKTYAYKVHKDVINDALQRRGTPGIIKPGPFLGSYDIIYSIKEEPLVSIVISTKDKVNFLRRCVDGVLSNTYQNFEIIIINNQSIEKETYEYFEKLKINPKVRILDYDRPFHIPKIFNYAVSEAKGEYILLLGNDIEPIKKDWLSIMVGHIQRKDVGGVGVKLLFGDKKVQHCGVILGLGPDRIAGHPYYRYPDEIGYGGLVNVNRNYSAVTGACFLTKRNLYLEVGGFDEDLRILFNDVDYCLKLRAKGFQMVYVPQAVLFHHESTSLGKIETRGVDASEVSYMKKKWGKLLENDPFYNPNLTLDKEDFSIRV